MSKSTSSKTAPAKRLSAQSTPTTETKSTSSALSARVFINMFLERWWIGLIVGGTAAAIFVLAQPKPDLVYRTEVKVLFEPQKDKVLNVTEVVDTTTSALQLNLHVEQIASTTFWEYVQQTFTAKEIEQIQAPYRDPQNPGAQPPSLANIIRPNLTINQQRSTTILRIGMANRDPEAAALIANRFARKYIDYTIDRALGGTNTAILFLKNQSEIERNNVETTERQMQEFRAKHNMAALGETKSIVQQKVTSLGSSIAQSQLDQANLRTLIETIEDYIATGKNIYELSAISGYGNVSELKNGIDGLKAQRRLLEERYLEEHRLMKENALALADSESHLKQQTDLALAELRSRYNFAKKQEQDFRRDYNAADKQSAELDKIGLDYKFLEQELGRSTQQYNTVVSRLGEASLVVQLDLANIKIMDRAPVPSWPDTGTPKKIAMTAAGIGLFLLIGLPIGIGFFDSRIKSPADVESGLNQVLLGGIKAMKKLSETERPNVFRLGKDDALSEAYRGIFSEIEIRSVVAFPKRILLTSSIPSEGKSLTASNLAAVFAAHGKRTLLVDCDFRRPTLRRYFGAQPGVGLLPWLRENGNNPDAEVSLEKLGVVNITAGFDVLTAGDAIKNPTEVIDQIANCDLFNKLSKHYDLVIVDTPPSAVFPDALLLSRFCAEMIYVCRFKTVRKALIKKTLSKFTESGITILGVVLNCVPHSSVMNYGYDGYGSYSADYYKSYQGEKPAPTTSS